MMRNVVAMQPQVVSGGAANVEQGRELYMRSCAACHGASGKGMPHQGADLVSSRFMADSTDEGLVEFLRVGRKADDPKSVMKLFMPAKGGNVALGDEHLALIVGYLRDVQKEARL
jgi:disulfide bond formation protein DsbB